MPVATKKTPATKSAPSKVSEKQKHSLTQESRNALRELIFASEDNTEFHPLDYATIRPIVKDEYLAIFDAALKSGKSCMVEIDLNKGYDPDEPITENAGFIFVHNWLKANGKNRNPNPAHYGMLAEGFREKFVPDATHWVVDSNGMVTNGGHSGRGIALAFYPPCVEYGVEGIPLGGDETVLKDETVPMDPDSEMGKDYLADCPPYYFASKVKDPQTNEYVPCVFESVTLPWKGNDGSVKRVGKYDESDKYQFDETLDDEGNVVSRVATDSPEVRLSQNLTIRLVINADPESCLKMDDVRLEASMDHYLQMVGPIKAFMQTLPKMVREKAGELFRQWYLRVNHSGGTATKPQTYGFLSKGGRLTKNEVQQWFIAGAPALLDSIALLTNDKGIINPMRHFKKPEGGRGGVSLVHALVAMMVSSPSGRERIAKELCRDYKEFSESPEGFQKLVGYLCLEKTDTQQINSDIIVQTLVLLGEGKGCEGAVNAMTATYPTGKDKNGKPETLSPWQVETNRAMGWDRCNTDEPVNEEFTSVCISAAERIASILGNEGAVKDAKMKATRKGAGKRGPNAKK